MPRVPLLALILLLPVVLVACSKKEPARPPERVTSVTVARAVQKDIAVIESAVGMESALDQALHYDPTRVKTDTFYIRLPFPEHVARQLAPGQAVRVSTFAEPQRAVMGTIREIRPALNVTTQSRDVIVTVTNSGWRPVGSIRGEVTLGVRRGATAVPEQAVVLRPAGAVVYVVEGEVAKERSVRTGPARAGLIEIVEGIKPDEVVVVDGAALLSGDARIRIRDARP